jgi:hypothetical protein
MRVQVLDYEILGDARTADATAAPSVHISAPPIPSRSPTASLTPSPSASPRPIVPGVIEWWNVTGHSMQVRGVPGRGERVVSTHTLCPPPPSSPCAQSGVDGTAGVFVCRALLPGGEAVAGKYLDVFAGRFCNTPVYGVEDLEPRFQMLRWNPLLAWLPGNATTTPPPGAAWVTAGVYQVRHRCVAPVAAPCTLCRTFHAENGRPPTHFRSMQGLPVTVCRALHPTVLSGPHSGA